MSEPTKKFYLTTPIYYVNARPHIGHAYTTIVADVVARRHRLLGEDTFFLTGTDEHGQKIERSAAAANIPPQAFADEVSASFQNLWKRMGITHNDFIRTTDKRHQQGVQKLWRILEEKGFIELRTYTGQYCVSEEMFVDGPPGTIGPDGKPTETVSEENYFFKLSLFGDRIATLIESGELNIQPDSRRNEILSFVKSGLKDLSISRTSFKWGIPVPNNEKHVIYVWLDALANYMTAIGYGSEAPADIAQFNKYWPADLHLVGKEIIRFHCVYWPAFLLAAEIPLPKSIVAHGWLLFEESKMSKSRGNIVRTETILDAFGSLNPEATKQEQDLFATDVLRYFLLREIPFGQDGSFSFDALVQRYNSDLANGYGNLVSRTLSMIHQYFDGNIPESRAEDRNQLLDPSYLGAETFAKLLEQSQFSKSVEVLWAAVAFVDTYISTRAPWKLAKQPDEASRFQLDSTLATAAESIRIITALLYPILPYATAKVWQQLGLGDIEEAARTGQLKNLEWGGLKPGTKLGALAPIFPRADKGLIQIMTDMETPKPSLSDATRTAPHEPVPLDPTDPAAPPRTSTIAEENPGALVGGSSTLVSGSLPVPSHTEAHPSGVFATAAATKPITAETAQIAIDDFLKVELRVAQILIAERIPKADKLLRLEVDLGYEKRQILSGIAEWYTPEELVGKKIIVITNLAPRKMRGLESHGMLLAGSADATSKPILATMADQVANGTRLK